MTKTDPETIAVYDAKANDYADAFTKIEGERGLLHFMNKLPKGARILDLGCGPGAHAATMHQHGFDVVATDASAAMVEIARKHEGIEVRQATFDDLIEENEFDGIWAHFSLLHATRDQFPVHLSSIAHALKPGGLFQIGLKTGKGEKRDHLGRFYTFYTVEELQNHLQKAGFSILSEMTGEGVGLAGTLDPWIEILAGLKVDASHRQ